MIGSQAIGLEERFPSELAGGRDAQLAVLITAKWRDEIERAIDRVKKPVNRSELDRWFRKQWYRMEARGRKKYGGYQRNRRQIGEHGGNENGGGYRRTWGAAHRAARAEAVRRGPAVAAVQEREESARIRGFRQRERQEDV